MSDNSPQKPVTCKLKCPNGHTVTVAAAEDWRRYCPDCGQKRTPHYKAKRITADEAKSGRV